MIEVSAVAGLICAGVVFFSDVFAEINSEPDAPETPKEQPSLPAKEEEELNLVEDEIFPQITAELQEAGRLNEIQDIGQKTSVDRCVRFSSLPSALGGA
eukprot:CAMPEP_0115215802 /NCGR_PEP_ID=MMETSP0270-20121206/25008_1 /TAXON_ID=71861 /ORGANISM="Scrippsiella trochoidea, Strain CCMP3099" /LENGTH=98 /DNA_ID=CAMNT_0002629615 /DNA_START=116 /DNA_END=412 /DNA_ORIENTATION=-